MNPDLEERLQALRPAEPPADLLKQLLDSEPPAPGKIRWLHLFTRSAAAAAVAALVALPLLRGGNPAKPRPIAAAGPPPSDFRVFVPIEQTSTLLDVRNVAVSDVDPSHPIRFVRATWVDDTTYAGDDGHSTLRRREPRTEILSVPLDSL
jgi:hypothetical protein